MNIEFTYRRSGDEWLLVVGSEVDDERSWK